MLNNNDIQQIEKRGISVDEIEKQIEKLKKGFIPVNLVAPATINKGIFSFSEEEKRYYISFFENEKQHYSIIKFVPASGAATRMFKDLFACYEELCKNTDDSEKIINKYPKVVQFFQNIEKFAFYASLCDVIKKQGKNLADLIKNRSYKEIIEYFLKERGLNYGSLPKALIDFHCYSPDDIRKALDEHLVEAVSYANNNSGQVNIHFTISPEHEKIFNEHISKTLPIYEKKHKIKYNVTYSFQHPSTDTISLDFEDNLIRNEKGELLFRPAGHGALLKNLSELEEDIIFIKNIDNVAVDRLKHITYEYKKVLAGFLLKMREEIEGHICLLKEENCTEEDIEIIFDFVKNKMNETYSVDFHKLSKAEKQKFLLNCLNRPIRVCAMVKNEGEPGGGPFFVKNANGTISLQIVEKAQINVNDRNQNEILNNSTHFNPVDIVCTIKDINGEKFDLQKFVDEDTYIITEKSKDGKPLKALELPGLWNGSMANWITFFVEAPIETFTPVKEINDLLRKEHIA